MGLRERRCFWIATATISTIVFVGQAKAETVYVGDYSGHQIRRFDGTGAAIGTNPWLTGITPEGISCLENVPGVNPHLLYIADPSSGKIVRVDATTGAIVNPNFITGLSGVANTAFSTDGRILYVAEESGNRLDAYNSITGALINRVTFTGAHDVIVGNNGSVYATAYGSSTPASQGVVEFSADLSSHSTFIGVGNNNLYHATGMAFDNNGNFWVANAGSIRSQPSAPKDFVSEYTAAGVFVKTVTNAGIINPFDLSNAGDGTIAVSAFGTIGQTSPYNGSILKINTTTDAVSTFIAAGIGNDQAGLNPKYVSFEADCVTYSAVPEPSSLALALVGSLGFAIFAVRRRLIQVETV
jgi:hypothetical protein